MLIIKADRILYCQLKINYNTQNSRDINLIKLILNKINYQLKYFNWNVKSVTQNLLNNS